MKQIFDKDKIKELENNTVPLQMFPVINRKYFKEYFKIISWYHKFDDIDANSSIYKKWNKLSEILECKPSVCVNHLYRNALWVFTFNNNHVLLYYDKRGMKIQVNDDISKKDIKFVLSFFNDKINN